MKTERRPIGLLTIGVVTIVVCVVLSAIRADQKPREAGARDTDYQTENQSLSSVLFALAAERFADNEKRGEQWILAVHDWGENTNVVRYTDRRYNLISIPALEDDLIGYRQYVSAYNSFNIRAADRKAASGDYRTAAEMYRLLLRSKPRGEAKDELEKRLRCLASLEKGEDAKPALDELLKDYRGLEAFPKLAEVWTTRPIAVTNWDHVVLP